MSYNMFRLKYIRSLINMGWYHVDRTGKGVMLNFLDCTEDLIEKLAITKDKLERGFPQDKFPNAELATALNSPKENGAT